MKDSEKTVSEVDKMMFSERVQRLEFLLSVDVPPELPYGLSSGFISLDFFEESKRCWLYGLFVPSIIMMQLAFQEGMRFIFGSYENINNLDTGLSKSEEMDLVNQMGFQQLINFVREKNLISDDQVLQLHELRRLRNPLVHVKGTKNTNISNTTSLGNSEPSLFMKITELAPAMKDYISEPVLVKDSKTVISMCKLYYDIFSGPSSTTFF